MAIDYYVEFVTVPLAVLVLAIVSPPFTNAALNAWVAGYLLWVLIEYWMHRWLFHRVFRHQHMIHHHRPLDPDGSPGTALAHAALGAAVALLLGTFQAYIGGALAGGLLVGYGTYIYTHHAVHAGWLSPGSRVAKRHELHHRGVEKNYNVLNPLGDMVFGTYV